MSSNVFHDYADVPIGLCLIRVRHESSGEHCMHLHFKLDDGPWYWQPKPPTLLSQAASKKTHPEFWRWAEQTLPVWDRPEPVRASA